MPEAYAWSRCEIEAIPEGEDGQSNSGLTSPWIHVHPDTPGLWVWWVTNNQACPWPREDYGQFYQSAVYIVLTISQEEHKLDRNLHVLLGKYASEADYRSVLVLVSGLRRALAEEVRLHRQVQGRETALFRHIFNPAVYWLGGPERSYRHCSLHKTTYKARLVQLFKPDVHADDVVGKEVPCNVKELDPAFTYILDTGSAMYMWQGNLTSTQDDIKSIRFLENIRAARGGGVKVEVLNEEQLEGHAFFNYLSHDGYRREDDYRDEDQNSTLHRNSLLGGNVSVKRSAPDQLIQVYYDPKTANRKKRASMPSTILGAEFRAIKHGEISARDMAEGDLFLYDTGERVWLWLGKKALETEKQMSLHLAHLYLKDSQHHLLPLTVVTSLTPDVELDARLKPKNQNGRHSAHRNGR